MFCNVTAKQDSAALCEMLFGLNRWITSPESDSTRCQISNTRCLALPVYHRPMFLTLRAYATSYFSWQFRQVRRDRGWFIGPGLIAELSGAIFNWIVYIFRVSVRWMFAKHTWRFSLMTSITIGFSLNLPVENP